MKLWLFALIVLAPQPVLAAPTYLACTIEEAGKVQPLNLMLDEAARQAVISFGGEDAGRSGEALFTPTEVKIADKFYTWTIDRVSLELQRTTLIGDKRWDETGKCSIAKAPANRAF